MPRVTGEHDESCPGPLDELREIPERSDFERRLGGVGLLVDQLGAVGLEGLEASQTTSTCPFTSSANALSPSQNVSGLLNGTYPVSGEPGRQVNARCDTGGCLRMLVGHQRRPPLAERVGAMTWSDGLAPRRDGISGGDVRRTPSPNWPSDASCIVGASGSGCTGRWHRGCNQTLSFPSSDWQSGSTDAFGMGTRLTPGLPSRGPTLNCGRVRSRPIGSEICGPVTSPDNLAGTLIGVGVRHQARRRGSGRRHHVEGNSHSRYRVSTTVVRTLK